MAETKTETTGETKADDQRQYEGMFLLPPSASTDLDAASKLVRGIIEKHAGQVMLIKKWDERKLAYEVKKQKRGLYVIAYFKAPAAAIAQIERDVNLSDDVLRLLVTHADHLNQEEMNAVEPQPIQPREERNPWDRPEGMGGGGGRRDDRQRDDRGDRPRDDRPRDDRPRDDRPREGGPAAPREGAPRRRDEMPAEAAKD